MVREIASVGVGDYDTSLVVVSVLQTGFATAADRRQKRTATEFHLGTGGKNVTGTVAHPGEKP
jgi:hypothetical protein